MVKSIEYFYSSHLWCQAVARTASLPLSQFCLKQIFTISTKKHKGKNIRLNLSQWKQAIQDTSMHTVEPEFNLLSEIKIKTCVILGRARRPGVYWRSRWTGQTALWWCTTSATALPSSMPRTSCGRSGRRAWTTAKGQKHNELVLFWSVQSLTVDRSWCKVSAAVASS